MNADQVVVVQLSNVSSAFNSERLFNVLSVMANVDRISVDPIGKRASCQVTTRQGAEKIVEFLHLRRCFLRELHCRIVVDNTLQFSSDPAWEWNADFSNSPLRRFERRSVDNKCVANGLLPDIIYLRYL